MQGKFITIAISDVLLQFGEKRLHNNDNEFLVTDMGSREIATINKDAKCIRHSLM